MHILGVPFPPIGELNCRDVIVEKPSIVGAQPTGKCYKILRHNHRGDLRDLIVIFHFIDGKYTIKMTFWIYTMPVHTTIYTFKLVEYDHL